VTVLVEQNHRLLDEIAQLREELANSRLEAGAAQRERDELRQFIADHREFGAAFEQYRAVKAEAERQARREQMEESRQRQAQQRAERDARAREARALRAERDAARQRIARYERAGFSPVGLDVFTGRSAFYYGTRDQLRNDLQFDPLIGFYNGLEVSTVVDYSRMTISGSVLNAGAETRNIGIAVAFFDESGNQVGAETVQISNARPDVPYPFTSEIRMALNRPFTSSTIYTLFADPIAPAAE
jgi:hypothetical protein